MNYGRFLNTVSALRRPSAIRELTALVARSPPSTISLAGGMPNAKLFPFQSAEIQLRNGEKLHLDEKRLSTALQYAPTQGLPDLVAWLTELQAQLHDPPTLTRDPLLGGLDLVVTIGAQDGLCKAMEMLISAGDNVVIDCPTYSGSLSVLHPLGCNLLPVQTDEDGMLPSSLRDVLARWSPADAADEQSDVPRVLYTVPNGVNPTGASLTLQRKQQIYQICKDYDMIILEDDPYFYLQYGERVPSFLSMDEDGRVIRFDSFSKILSSGLRIGFATGPRPLVEKLQLHMQASVLHAPSLSQVLISDILHKWGLDGFLAHVDEVVSFYSLQKDEMMAALAQHMSSLAEWNEPKAGMFVWLKLNDIPDTKDLIEKKALEKEVVLVPGSVFMPDCSAPCPYVRAAFSVATPTQIHLAMERLASLVREEVTERSDTHGRG